MTTRTEPKPRPVYFCTLRPYGDLKLRPPRWHIINRYEKAEYREDGHVMIPVGMCGRKGTATNAILQLIVYRRSRPRPANLICRACQNR